MKSISIGVLGASVWVLASTLACSHEPHEPPMTPASGSGESRPVKSDENPASGVPEFMGTGDQGEPDSGIGRDDGSGNTGRGGGASNRRGN